MMENRSSDDSIASIVEDIVGSIEHACGECGRKSSEVNLMAVTKTVEPERVNEAIKAGICLLGENKAQELISKYDDYQKKDVDIHFIGKLQSNKVRQIIDKVDMIESIDSLSLAGEVQRQCEKQGRNMDCLVEINIGNEKSKSGVSIDRIYPFLEEISKLPNLFVRGIMSIPPVSDSNIQKERYFFDLHKLFVDIKEKKLDNVNMDFLSMGMSDDYLLAIKHGSNIVRLGTVIFGRRSYANQK